MRSSYTNAPVFIAPVAEIGVPWNNSNIAIDWPIDEPILSDKDAALPYLNDADVKRLTTIVTLP